MGQVCDREGDSDKTLEFLQAENVNLKSEIEKLKR
jgi:hypothetical protein